MALPTTIASGSNAFPLEQHYLGPFISSGGNVYVVMSPAATPGYIQVFKATDPTSSFTEQDSTNRPANTGVINFSSVFAYQVGDVITIASQRSSDWLVEYHEFTMSSDSWTTTHESVETPKDTPNYNSTPLAQRSDGDVIVLYSGDQDAIMGTSYNRADYARRESGSWTVGVNVADATEENWIPGNVVLGATDRMHFHVHNLTGANDVYHRSLESDNTLNTLQAITGLAYSPQDRYPMINGVAYVSGASTIVRFLVQAVPVVPSTNIQLADISYYSEATPTFSFTGSIAGLTVANRTNFYPVASMALSGTTTWVLWARGSDNDLYSQNRPAATFWQTAVEQIDAVTITRISANAYTRSGSPKLAFVYYDETNTLYNEIDLSPAATTKSSLDQIGIAAQEAGFISTLITRTEAVDLATQEVSLSDLFSNRLDAIDISFIEKGTILVVTSAFETLDLAVETLNEITIVVVRTEQVDVEIQEVSESTLGLTGTDQDDVQAQEVSESAVSSTRFDQDDVEIQEVSESLVSSIVNDLLDIALIEKGQITVSLSGSDTLDLQVQETSIIDVFITTYDQPNIVLQEQSTTLASLIAFDILNAALDESSQSVLSSTVFDQLDVDLQTSALIEAVVLLTLFDQLNVEIQEVSESAVSSTRFDQVDVETLEHSVSVLTSVLNDLLDVSVDESSQSLLTSIVLDLLNLDTDQTAAFIEEGILLLTVLDQLDIAIQEVSESALSSVVHDSIDLEALEQSINFITSIVLDTIAISTEEVSESVVSSTVFDQLDLDTNLTAAIIAEGILLLTVFDQLNTALQESSSSFISSLLSDSTDISLEESSASSVASVVFDLLNVALQERGQPQVNLEAFDQLDIADQTSAAILAVVLLTLFDQLDVAVQEQSSNFVTSILSEQLNIVLQERGQVDATTTVFDQIDIAGQERALVAVAINAQDQLDIALDVISSVFKQLAALSLTATDSVSLNVQEASVLDAFSTRHDEVGVQLDEKSQLDAFLTRFDQLDLSWGTAAFIFLEVTAGDSLNVNLDELASVLAILEKTGFDTIDLQIGDYSTKITEAAKPIDVKVLTIESSNIKIVVINPEQFLGLEIEDVDLKGLTIKPRDVGD